MRLEDYQAERKLKLERVKFNRRNGYLNALRSVQRAMLLLREEYYQWPKIKKERRGL